MYGLIAAFFALPFHVIMLWVLIAFTVILTLAALISKARENARTRARYKRSQAIARHPAGKGLNAPRVLEDTRHLDRPGYDWVNGPL